MNLIELTSGNVDAFVGRTMKVLVQERPGMFRHLWIDVGMLFMEGDLVQARMASGRVAIVSDKVSTMVKLYEDRYTFFFIND